jgi:hypothetical protein
VFPEGKSNENHDILPFNAGSAIVALNCMNNFGMEVKM